MRNPGFESLAIALEEFRGITAEFLHSSDAQILQRRQELELEIDLKRDISGLQKIIADILHTLSRTHLLLVIDQFEEVYTLCPNAQERQIFIDSLLNAVNHTPWFTLLITLRADFLGKAMSYQPLGKALQDYPPSLLVPMNRDELERAIIQPATRFSVELEEGLVNKLIDDVGSGEGSLPLQQFALTQLWGKQRPGLLTHQAYTEIGGVTQALKNHADVVYAGLSEAQQKRAQRLFIQLVQPGEGTEDTRRLATRDEVGDYWDLVTLLANERLLVTNRSELVEDTVEVVHEALIRNWGRLQGWMDDNREFRVWQERLKVALQQWVESGKDEGALLRSATLAVAEDWLQKRGEEVSKPQRWFIEKGVGLRERERKQKQRLRRGIIAGLVCGLVVISGFAGVSEIRRTDAEIGRLSVTAEKYFAQNDHEAALTEVIKAGKLLKNIWKPWITSENRMLAVSTLQQVVDEFPIKTLKGHGHTDEVNSVRFSPDGKILAASNDYTVKLWDINTGKEIKTLREPGVRSVSFSPDGRTLAFAGDGITLWDTTTGRKIKTLMGNSVFNDVKFSPNGKTFASASHYPFVTIWDTTTGRKIRDLEHGHRVNQVSYSPDGKILASTSDDQKVTLWDTSNGRILKTFEEEDQVVYVSFSPDGKIVASALSLGSQITIRDVSTGKILTFLNHSGHIMGISFSPDSKTIASASSDNTIQLWDVNTGNVVSTLRSNITWRTESIAFSPISFSPDGRTIAFPSDKNTVRLWNIKNTTRAKTILHWKLYDIFTDHIDGTKTKISSVRSFSFSSDNKIVAGIVYGNAYGFQPGGSVKLWNTSNGKEIRTLLLGDQVIIMAISFSVDGKTIALALDDGTITFWDVSTGEKIKTFKDYTISVNIDFSSDNKTLASALSDGTITLWDVNTGIKIKNLTGIKIKNLLARADSVDGNGFYPNVDFSPDGKILASTSLAGTVKLWNVDTGKEIKILKSHAGRVFGFSFSPDGKILASASDEGTMKLWNVNTGKEIKSLKISPHDFGESGVIFKPESPLYDFGESGVSFSPDSKTIAYVSWDNTVKLWDVDTRREIKILEDHAGSILDIKFSADGKTLVSYVSEDNEDNTVVLSVLSNFDLDNLLMRGCGLIQDYLENNSDVRPEDRHLCDDIKR
ncbi:CHAT domain-containing protein [Nostoc sphaeroides CCNUC1]|uniref:CHAT domain-containing protein n=1 Tax=Nostoc sphaeroides CCNUC1 TaxID=2653204 RepID=A0A5P8WGT1_9NOSO|nr:CHAT domain-containing protein [Nostoc sphaeroides CCNUC1]